MTYISSNNGRHLVTKTFTPLHPTPLHYTFRHFTSSHLNFTTSLPCTTPSFGLTPLKFPTAPNSNRVWAYVIVWRRGWRLWRVCCCWLGGGLRFWISVLGGKAFCMGIRVVAVSFVVGCVVANFLKNRVAFISKFLRSRTAWPLKTERQYVPCNAVNGSPNDTPHRRRPGPSTSPLGEHQTQEKLWLSGDWIQESSGRVDYKPPLIWESLILFNNYTLEFASQVSQVTNTPVSVAQCFWTSVRPRPGKFFFHKTRARYQQIYS